MWQKKVEHPSKVKVTTGQSVTEGEEEARGHRAGNWPWLCAVRWGWAIRTAAGSQTGWGRRESHQSAPCSSGDCCPEPPGSSSDPKHTDRRTCEGRRKAFSSFIRAYVSIHTHHVAGKIVAASFTWLRKRSETPSTPFLFKGQFNCDPNTA